VRHFQEALAVNRELNDPAAICETLNNLGLAHQSQGHLREAQATYLEALEQARLLPPGPLLALTLTHQGDVARTHKDYTLALNYYHQASWPMQGPKTGGAGPCAWSAWGAPSWIFRTTTGPPCISRRPWSNSAASRIPTALPPPSRT